MTTCTCRELAKFVGLGKQCGVEYEFERTAHGRTSILSDIHPSVTPKGHGSLRTILLREDGHDVAYDGRYVFQLMAWRANGERYPLALLVVLLGR